MDEGMNILEHKYVQFRQWLDNISRKKGLESKVTIAQVLTMLSFLDQTEKKMDEIILKAFED